MLYQHIIPDYMMKGRIIKYDIFHYETINNKPFYRYRTSVKDDRPVEVVITDYINKISKLVTRSE
jgi:hypothetical protein